MKDQCNENISFILSHLLVSLYELVLLEADEAGDERGRGGDGRDDAAGDKLGLVAVGGRDAVVLGAEVGGRHDEVHVKVGVVVLLEVSRRDDEAGRQLGLLGQAVRQLVELLLVAHLIKGDGGDDIR